MSAARAGDSPATESHALSWAGMGMGELDLAYLLTAQRLVKRDKAAAMSRLGMRPELAAFLEQLSPSQLALVAASRWPCDLPAAGIGAFEHSDRSHRIATICD